MLSLMLSSVAEYEPTMAIIGLVVMTLIYATILARKRRFIKAQTRDVDIEQPWPDLAPESAFVADNKRPCSWTASRAYYAEARVGKLRIGSLFVPKRTALKITLSGWPSIAKIRRKYIF
eukprot:GEMP01072076.1.p2 GENE.GEMP01072076.1~~GEMP01072076.1.p2  ORF type:complete len:119 (+),score=21.62 GEMP01072076.1:57-413(+)